MPLEGISRDRKLSQDKLEQEQKASSGAFSLSNILCLKLPRIILEGFERSLELL
jgi:hypothetical protein